ncbi:hypothetical protein [Idiomarina sp. A28L]|uniref:hypothetical protein n=1 Tax=Idiomarina sp. A28L TaxID=1036674 RepID=UPI0002F9E1C1|nr:hypothetical protein [Idiomarina sp. A28L]
MLVAWLIKLVSNIGADMATGHGPLDETIHIMMFILNYSEFAPDSTNHFNAGVEYCPTNADELKYF